MARPPRPSPSFRRMIGRAVLGHCPWCGSRRTFLRGWFGRHERCRTCGIRWHREVGFELGAVTINTIVTFFTLTVAMAVAFILTVPDVPAGPLVVMLVGIALLMPVAIYPLTYTVWLAFDLAMHRPEAAELAEARAAVTDTSPT